ncbi:MAG: hypothetical protein ACR2QC_02200 [Gammaproteobacteria bacterium]
MSTNMVQPLMSEADMTTMDGVTAFPAQLSCPSSKEYVRLALAPGPTGDITTAVLQRDTDFDGALDSTFALPTPISGICANGIIMCTPGTWNSCNHFSWSAPSGALQLDTVTAADLKGCYCVNNSCGTALFATRKDEVLTTVGGGIVGALSAVNPTYAVSSVDITGTEIVYYGQNASDCGFTGTGDRSSYYRNYGAIETDARSATGNPLVVNGSAVDPGAPAHPGLIYDIDARTYVSGTRTTTVEYPNPYDMISSSTAAGSVMSDTLVDCRQTRSFEVEDATALGDIITHVGGTGAILPCGPGCLSLVIGTVGNNYWCDSCNPHGGLHEGSVTFGVKEPSRIISAKLLRVKWDDWIQVIANGSLLWTGPGGSWTDVTSFPPPGACELGTEWDAATNVDFTSLLTGGATSVDFGFRVAVGGCGEGYALAEVLVRDGCSALPETITDGCQILDTDPACSLYNEVVDGVRTIDSGSATGLSPLASAVTKRAGSCEFTETRPWWRRDRQYKCSGPPSGFELSDALARHATISSSASTSGFDDRRIDPNTGTVTMSSETMALPTVVATDLCTQACKIRHPKAQNDVAGVGPEQMMESSAIEYEFEYRECRGGCPLEPGDSLVMPCQCINEFAEAAIVMQMMRLAGQDMLCTSGVRVPDP